MRFLQKVKDGGPNSNVDAYVLIEIKSAFSIMLLKFNKGHRDNYHNHAFNAWSIPLTAEDTLYEEYPDSDKVYFYKRYKPKYTPKRLMHRVVALTDSWALTFRGPWDRFWHEQTPEGKRITFGWRRKIIKESVA